MKRLFLICLTSTMSTAAFAHNSVAPHTHPHDVSMLPDLSVMLLAALAIAYGAFALRMMRRS